MKVAHALWALGAVHAARGDHAAAAQAYTDAVARHAKARGGLVREQGTLLWLAARSYEASPRRHSTARGCVSLRTRAYTVAAVS